ncbi:cytochrome oxidase maturation protein, cbb3-type [Arsukibacterium tuosuense]|uniref:Cytochrome oxidase maturation protein, cbb3-type n=1 Tax=Arsukibacterium tuosuense TaxID=1323745 RepID=A0A285I472_9GAMM|nr:cbb3-type cytochrome oxidase assembly protein CcoS [Arsukibacterium tuosuense]SNY42812.1 cytochrome oxidase maturation protein, cbb3-type [Arsukibacterium tuosuense]
MSIIYVLIPIAILFVMLGLAIFFWAVRSKQFEDLDKEGFSILFDEQQAQAKTAAKPETQGTATAATDSTEQNRRQQDDAGQ